MNSLDKFKLKMSFSGNSLREEHIQNSRNLLSEVFDDDPSLAQGIYFWQLGKLGKEAYEYDEPVRIRIYHRAFSAAQGVTMSFQTLYDTPIVVGDVLYNSNSDEYYICTESFDIDSIHWEGRFTLCNWILKWQDKRGDILEYPCYDINTTQYNSGEQSNKQFTIGSSQHMLTLPCDENTVALKTPKRIFLDRNYETPSVFIVTQNDTTSYAYGKKGLVKVTVTENVFDHDTDRIDLGICDYVEPEGSYNENVDKRTMRSEIYYDTDVIKSGGDSQRFTAKFFDANNVELTGVVPIWNMICPFADSLDIEYVDNDIVIGIDDDAYIDEDFKIILSDDRRQCTSSLLIRVESLL